MKKSSLFIAAGFIILASVSCKKDECHECHYEKNDVEVELGERCGDDLKNIEASGFNDGGVVYEVHCHEH